MLQKVFICAFFFGAGIDVSSCFNQAVLSLSSFLLPLLRYSQLLQQCSLLPVHAVNGIAHCAAVSGSSIHSHSMQSLMI
jgi:hypothetical protein